MHEETADKLFVAESDLPFGLSRFFPRAEKVTSVSETERMRLFEMAIRCV